MTDWYIKDTSDTKRLNFHCNVKYVIQQLLDVFGMKNSGYIASQVIRRERDFIRDKNSFPTPIDTIGMLSMYFSDEKWDEFSIFLGNCLGVFIDTDEVDVGKVLCKVLLSASRDERLGMYYEDFPEIDLGVVLINK